jgi:DNA-binding SARP family transcriptional activator
VGYDLRFGVLGPVQVCQDGTDLAVGPPQQQSVLAMLLLAEGHPVSAAKLVDGLWSTTPPSRAVGALRNYVHRLRRILEPDPTLPSVLRSAGSGYALEVAADTVDTGVFEEKVALARRRQAAGAITEASTLLHEALGLHRGEPLAGVPGPYARLQRSRLTERRLAVLEDRLELDLLSGRHAEIAAELGELVAAHPLRERLLAQRMIALYRSGQRTAALDAFASGRRGLVAELDVEPGPELRELRQRILTGQDVPLAAVETGTRQASGRARPSAPAQLPATIADFTGRTEIAGALAASVLAGTDRTMSVSVISGLGGVGKTALAVYVANQVKDNFPDGQLYAQLYGVDEAPAPPEQVLRSFLIALGVAEHTVPDGVDERSALLRSTLAGRKFLLVLDNAHNARQVMPLLPGTGGCAVLITSRSKLTSLPGARKFELPVFETDEALALLRRIAGPRADDEAARAVVDACGRLPLAVRISAARLVSRPNWTMPLLAERLADQRGRLDELRVSDLAVAGTFRLGYDQLEPESARAFRLLSVSGPHGFSRYSAAAVLDRSLAEAERLCEGLVDLSLLESAGAGRYRYHDLVRLFASTHAMEDEPAADRVDALSRLLDFHLNVPITTVAFGLNNDATRASLADAAYVAMPLADMSSARTWLTGSDDSAGADVARGDRGAADALYRLVQRIELDSIAELTVVVARMVCTEFGPTDPPESPTPPPPSTPWSPWSPGRPLITQEQLACTETALARVRSLLAPDEERARAQVGFVAAVTAVLRGEPDQARTDYLDTLARCRATGDIRGEVLTIAGLARTSALLDDPADADRLGEQAVRLAREHGDLAAEGFAVHVLGQLARMRGDTERVEQHRADTVRLWLAIKQPTLSTATWLPASMLDLSDQRDGMGEWLGILGHALADLDRREQARACWQQAIAILSGLGHPNTEELHSLVRFG